jgi:hypothetical protein
LPDFAAARVFLRVSPRKFKDDTALLQPFRARAATLPYLLCVVVCCIFLPLAGKVKKALTFDGCPHKLPVS